jgi:hypothetical protein
MLQREALAGVRIGAWSNKRRLQYKAGTMPADRVAALEAVPGWWWSADQMPAEEWGVLPRQQESE